MGIFISVMAATLATLAFYFWRNSVRLKRAEFIRTYSLPKGLFEKLQKQYPHLEYKDCSLVARGLRKFFLAYLNSGRRFVSMPSQIVDDLWHEFILHTRAYDEFCRKAFGGFLHHVPASVLGAGKSNNEGLRRAWWHSCKEENTNPSNPARLPLLFALDAKLAIPNGFQYAPDCKRTKNKDGTNSGGAYCGGDFSSTSIDGCLDGFGNASSNSGFSFDIGGGDGNGGCGGGCGGGGCGGS